MRRADIVIGQDYAITTWAHHATVQDITGSGAGTRVHVRYAPSGVTGDVSLGDVVRPWAQQEALNAAEHHLKLTAAVLHDRWGQRLAGRAGLPVSALTVEALNPGSFRRDEPGSYGARVLCSVQDLLTIGDLLGMDGTQIRSEPGEKDFAVQLTRAMDGCVIGPHQISPMDVGRTVSGDWACRWSLFGDVADRISAHLGFDPVDDSARTVSALDDLLG